MELTKKEYLEFLEKYIERDKKIFHSFIGLLEKAKGAEWLIYLAEVGNVIESLGNNIRLIESAKKYPNDKDIKFFINNKGFPVKYMDIDQGFRDKFGKKIEDLKKEDFIGMFG